MRVRHRAFALLIVLVAVGGIFALGMRSAASARAVQIESRVLSERVVGERLARTAAVLVLRGLTTPPTPENRASSDTFARAGAADSPPALADAADQADEDKEPDLPAILREMLGQEAEDVKKAEDAAKGGANRLSDGGGLTGRRTSARDGLALLQRVGLPVRPIDVTVEGRRLRVTLHDAGGTLNINAVDEERFTRYLTLKGVESVTARRIAQQLLDWRDADTIARADGAEAPEYQGRGIGCRNADLFAMEELLYLPSMTRDIFERIKPDLCSGGDGKAHIGSASPEVLLSIDGMTPQAVEELLNLRANNRLTPESAQEALRAVWDRAKEKLRVSPSGFVSLTVTTVGRVNQKGEIEPVQEARKFEGIAIVSDAGVVEIGLRSL